MFTTENRRHVDFTGHGFSDDCSRAINFAAERRCTPCTEADRYIFATIAINAGITGGGDAAVSALLREAARVLA